MSDVNLVIVKKIIGEKLKLSIPVDQIKLDEDLTNFGLSSIDFVKIVLGIETELDMEFDNENLVLKNYKSIRKLVELIDNNY